MVNHHQYPCPGLNVALDKALHSIATSSKQLKGCIVEGTFTTRNIAPNDIKKIVDEVHKINHKGSFDFAGCGI